MTPTNLTLEEQERWAYANGDTQQAKLLAEADDLRSERDSLAGEVGTWRDRACAHDD